jgi:hypothetical protein
MFGGFKLFNTLFPTLGTAAGPHDVFFTNSQMVGAGQPFTDFTSTITVVARAANWMGDGSNPALGYVGMSSYRFTSEMNLYAIDEFDGKTRNALVEQPYFLKTTNDPIYINFEVEYLGEVYETWFKIVEKSSEGRTTAAPGGIVREYNILAYLNGFSIPSLNIDGNTVVNADLLALYGYDVVWCANRNRLSVTYNPCKRLSPNAVASDRELSRIKAIVGGRNAGVHAAHNVRVEVGTYWSRQEVLAYSIDGAMYVNIEHLGASVWNGIRREIRTWGQYLNRPIGARNIR